MKNRLSWSQFKLTKTYLIIIGLTATFWFLIRVIPKPSRASYPCMRAAAPLMSTFVIYLIGVSTSVFSFNKMKQAFQSSRYLVASLFLFISIMSIGVIFLNNSKDSMAGILSPMDNTFPIASNEPIGVAKGLFPGRVVWVHNDAATNENYEPNSAGNDWWYTNNNADEEVIKEMLKTAIITYSGTNNIKDAWDSIFKAFNNANGRGDVGYTAGEKIAIKINLTNSCCGGFAERMDANPQIINALLFELINNVGVDASNITLGDPYRDFRPEYIELVMGKFPNVNFVDGNGGDGVTKTVPSAEMVLKFSDKDQESSLPQFYLDATYFINMPCLKTHNDGGITLIAKNHQGSYLEAGMQPQGQSAFYMHKYLPTSSSGAGNYRHTVDYMGHEETGGKGLIYIVDGIWAGDSWEGYIMKYKSAPFNDDYPNSIFIGQDPVALESVCYDVLFEENIQDNNKGGYPISLKVEIADYLKQCASSDFWPAGLDYDPEGDGTPIGSLGVFEHWNNATDRQYSRNLGTGEGIELIYSKLILNSLTVSVNSLTIGAEANSTESFEIVSNTEWTVVSNQSWLTLSSESGSNNATITLTVEANETAEIRTASVTVAGTGSTDQIITVTQEGITNILFNSINKVNIASPNPFTDYTVFRVPKNISPNSNISIYNTKGELIRTLKYSGSELISWHGTNSENTNVANGLYIYKISDKTTNAVFTGKVMLQR